MKLLFKQRLLSWLGRYDVLGEDGEIIFTVEGQLGWGRCLHVLDAGGTHIGTVRQKLASLMPCFELYAYEEYLGCIRQEPAVFHTRFTFDCSDWAFEGDWNAWDFTITSPRQGPVAAVCKAHFQMGDTYAIDVPDPSNTLCVLLSVLAMEASRF
ncbi:MAG: LURP-one-related family protein [Oscillospiraceae bacterium]|nr:LURP-one-related family protein [Oscillospiraceae bacterium]